MNDHTLSRRELHRLAFAALGGLIAGTVTGCGGKPAPQKMGGGTEFMSFLYHVLVQKCHFYARSAANIAFAHASTDSQ